MSTMKQREPKTHSPVLTQGEGAGQASVAPVPVADPVQGAPHPREFDFLHIGEIPDTAWFDPLPESEISMWQ